MVVVQRKRRGHITNIVQNYLHEIFLAVWFGKGTVFNLYTFVLYNMFLNEINFEIKNWANVPWTWEVNFLKVG